MGVDNTIFWSKIGVFLWVKYDYKEIMYIIRIAILKLQIHIFLTEKYKNYIEHMLFPGHMCICNKNPTILN